MRGGRSSDRRPDDVIDIRDTIFSRLILWTDSDHNGLSEESELQSVGYAGIQSIGLDASRVAAQDEHGNTIVAKSQAIRTFHDGPARPITAFTVVLAR
jgi:hypothetical protein